MMRLEFMKELEDLLSDIPLDERTEAIQYYNDYLDDAGTEHEDEILKELGTPSRVAAIIKADLNVNAQEQISRGNYTETGYEDTVYKDEKYELEKRTQLIRREEAYKAGGGNGPEAYGYGSGKQAGRDKVFGNGSRGTEQSSTDTGSRDARQGSGYTGDGRKENTSGSNTGTYRETGKRAAPGAAPDGARVALIILLCILAIPVGLPIFFSLFGILIAAAATILALFIGFGIAGVVMIAVGFALIILGLVNLGVSLAGLAFCGSGLITFGLGILFLIFSILLCGKVLPALFRGIVKLVSLPFGNRRVAA